jgi:hypothetical protein
MMKNLHFLEKFLVVASLFLGVRNYAATNSATRVYPSGIDAAVQIGTDLYDSLDAKYRKKLQEPPVCTVPLDAPALAPVERSGESKAGCQVTISVGFVDLINHIAHAKAIDRVQPGFFDQYMTDLAGETATGTTPEARNIVGDRYWTAAIMNEQAGYFNQMMGMTMAINFARHYLGQFSKYAGQMQAGKLVPINNFLTSAEWDTGVKAGAVNSLNCALGTEGAKALFDAIGKMHRRPAWTAYIVPQNIDIGRLNKQLAKYEVDFFHGGLN